MRKVFALSVFTSLVSIVSAQTNRYDVNVYTNPLPAVSTKSSYQYEGITYGDILEMNRQFKENALERERLQLEREQMEWREIERRAAANAERRRIEAAAREEGMKIVSDEVETFNGTNLASKAVVPIKIRIVRRKNGKVDMSCLGIKINNAWKSCESPIISLQEAYQTSTDEDDRALVLELMDLGNYLLDTGTEIYIIK